LAFIIDQMNNYLGVIIKESLDNKAVLEKIKVVSTVVQKVIDRHKTPWLKEWTLHTIEIPEDQALSLAEEISRSLDKDHAWYADFKNSTWHYIVFLNKIFFIDQSNQSQYNQAKEYGLSLGIPEYQVNFHANVNKTK